jgi:hypothetical protein
MSYCERCQVSGGGCIHTSKPEAYKLTAHLTRVENEVVQLRGEVERLKAQLAEAFAATGRAPGVDGSLVEAVEQVRLSRDAHLNTALAWSKKGGNLLAALKACVGALEHARQRPHIHNPTAKEQEGLPVRCDVFDAALALAEPFVKEET